MARTKKQTYAILAIFFGFLISLVMVPSGFIPQRDLKDFNRLKSGEGETVQAESTGGASVRISGRRGGSSKSCTSWRYEIEGNERFFTDRLDCYAKSSDALSGTKAELIYDRTDLGTVFVNNENTLSKLEGTQTLMRLLSAAGVVVLLAAIIGLIVYKRSSKRPPTAQPQSAQPT